MRKNNKRALIVSTLCLLLCVSMLVGSTFAWFTDTASTSLNSIQAGTLDIQLLDEQGNNLEGKTLNFIDKDDNSLWEPGCTYTLAPVVVKNDGSLALKFQIVLSGINGDAKLNNAIEWTLDGQPIDATQEYHLLPGASETFTIAGHMLENAGNEYQGLSIESIAIAVTATQDTVEYDSNNNTYDEGAVYPVLKADYYVSTSDDLVEMLKAAEVGELIAAKTGSYVISESVATKGSLIVEAGEGVTIDLGGNTLSSVVSKDENAPTVLNYGNLIISNGSITNENATAGNTNVAAVHNVSGTLTLQDCTITNTAPTSGGSYAVVVEGGKVVMNDCAVSGGRGGIAVSGNGSVAMTGGSVSASVYYPLYIMGNGASSFDGVTFTKLNNSKGKAITYNCFAENEGTAVFTGCAFVSKTSAAVNLDISKVYTGFTFNSCTYTNVNEPA